MMKRRNILLFAAAGILLLTGCANQSSVAYERLANHTNPVRTETSETESEETQTEAESKSEWEIETDQRISAICEMKPVPIPEAGWTDETLLPVVSIVGKTPEMPFCLSELLYGYDLFGEDAAYYENYADSIFCDSLYLHRSSLLLNDLFADDSIPESEVPNMLAFDTKWIVVTEDEKERYPISINCVTIGSTVEELAAQIGDVTEDGEKIIAECQTESIRIAFSTRNGTVESIRIYSLNE